MIVQKWIDDDDGDDDDDDDDDEKNHVQYDATELEIKCPNDHVTSSQHVFQESLCLRVRGRVILHTRCTHHDLHNLINLANKEGGR